MRPTAVLRPVRSAATCRRWPSKAAFVGLLLLSALPLLTGCAGLGTAANDNVVMIRQFYAADPWIRDEEGRVAGVLARVYFAAAARDDEVPKGIFVPGTIKAELYVLTLRPDGTNERVLVHEWTFDEQQAQGYRVRRTSRMGSSYGLILRWPPEVNVTGREIQMQFSYKTQAGKVITQRGSRFRVPLPAGTPEPGETGAGRNQPTTRPHVKPGTE